MSDERSQFGLNENTPLVKSNMADHDVVTTNPQHNGADSNSTNHHNDKTKENHHTTTQGEDAKNKKAGFKLLKSFSGRRKYTLILITLASALAGMAFSMLGPFFPIEATRKGMDIATVGFVFGMFEVVIFITAPIYGTNLVRIGPRFLFVAGIFIGGSCNILFGVLQYCPGGTPFIAMSIIVRSVEALGFSAYITASFAIVATEFNESVGFVFGILETGGGLGFMIGPTIGGGLYELGGFGLPFYFAGISVLLNGVAIYKFLPALQEVPSKRKGSILQLLRSPMVSIPVFSVFVGVLGIATWDSSFAKRVEPMEFSIGTVGILFGILAFVYSIMSSLWGYITETKDTQAPLIIGGHFVFGLGYLLLGPSNLLPFIPSNLPVILVALACIGMSFGCSLVPTMKCMVIGATELGFENNLDTFGLVSGLFNSVHTLGGFMGPVGVGYLIQEFDFPIAYTVVGMCSVAMGVVTLVYFTIRNVRKRRLLYKNLDEVESDDTTGWQGNNDVGNIRVPFSRSLSMSIGSV